MFFIGYAIVGIGFSLLFGAASEFDEEVVNKAVMKISKIIKHSHHKGNK